MDWQSVSRPKLTSLSVAGAVGEMEAQSASRPMLVFSSTAKAGVSPAPWTSRWLDKAWVRRGLTGAQMQIGGSQ